MFWLLLHGYVNVAFSILNTPQFTVVAVQDFNGELKYSSGSFITRNLIHLRPDTYFNSQYRRLCV